MDRLANVLPIPRPDRYFPLPHFNQRTRFLLAVQLPILEQYHARIQSSLDAFETLSSTLVRAVPGALGVGFGSGSSDSGGGADTGRLTRGVDGVQRLCKALLSAKVIEHATENWGEDVVSPFSIFVVVKDSHVLIRDSSSLSFGLKSTSGLPCVPR